MINISSFAALKGAPNQSAYAAAKTGLTRFTESLALEWAPYGVRVNGIAPGTILWPEDETWRDEVARQRIINQTALKRIGEPEDIARAVHFLLADAPYITGQIIAVDGGRSISL